MKYKMYFGFGFAILLIVISILLYFAYETGYKQACMDFYGGKLKYDLVENPDGTKEWKKVSNNVIIIHLHRNKKHGITVFR